MEMPAEAAEKKLTFAQRQGLKELRRNARKEDGEPISEDDWRAYMQLATSRSGRFMQKVMLALPSDPRCGFCGAPFGGFGGRLVKRLGYRPSRKKPNLCDVCVELAPPGGYTTDLGVMFADMRGFTRLSEEAKPGEVSALLRRFYASAEKALFPDALIDKLIGDEVMALYVPILIQGSAAAVMLDGARDLLTRIGYGGEEGPFVEVGIGIDYGEAFIGNVGQGALFDFTAVGDVVNVASRLQGKAQGGEIVVSERVAQHLPEPPGERIEVELKGKSEPVVAYRSAIRESIRV